MPGSAAAIVAIDGAKSTSNAANARDAGDGDLGFRYRAAKRGKVFIHLRGRLATTLRGAAAEDFLLEIDGASFDQQQIMARATGNYRRGNERVAKRHPRNR